MDGCSVSEKERLSKEVAERKQLVDEVLALIDQYRRLNPSPEEIAALKKLIENVKKAPKGLKVVPG